MHEAGATRVWRRRVRPAMNRRLMWSGPEAAGGVATTHPELRRGRVWLAHIAPGRGQRAVVLLSRDREDGAGDPLLVAPLVIGVAAAGRVAADIPPGFDGAVVDVRRITAIDRSALVQPLARLAAPRLAEVDQALCEALGLDVPAWPSAGDLAAQPVTPPAANGAAPHEGPAAVGERASLTQPGALDQAGFAPPPAPPPLPEATAAVPDAVRDGGNTGAGFDDHPIAQLFGRPRPAQQQPAPVRAPVRSPAADVRAADVMPELLSIVQRRLHRSAPRLEALLSQAGEEGRTVEWAAAAVRHASVRGVMQSTLDEIAGEIAAIAAPGPSRPEARG